MKPLMPEDYVAPRRLRIEYIKKQNPYNAGEERTLAEGPARSLCIQGVAIPAKKREGGIEVQDGKGGVEMREDVFGGWSLTATEIRRSTFLREKGRAESGDYAQEIADEEEAGLEEQRRVMAEDAAKKKDKEKPEGFARGKPPVKGARRSA